MEKQYDRWEVISEPTKMPVGKEMRLAVRCKCRCGIIKTVPVRRLLTKQSRSCGCLTRDVAHENAKHGMFGSRIYRIWQGMHDRCRNENSPVFADYGGRGITVDPAWKDFETFWVFIRTLLQEGQEDVPRHLTIDRVKNNEGYNPSNVKLSTMKEQCNNRRSNTKYTIDGVTKTLAEWADGSGVRYKTVWVRIKSGKTIEEALSAPVRGWHGGRSPKKRQCIDKTPESE